MCWKLTEPWCSAGRATVKWQCSNDSLAHLTSGSRSFYFLVPFPAWRGRGADHVRPRRASANPMTSSTLKRCCSRILIGSETWAEVSVLLLASEAVTHFYVSTPTGNGFYFRTNPVSYNFHGDGKSAYICWCRLLYFGTIFKYLYFAAVNSTSQSFREKYSATPHNKYLDIAASS